MGRVSLSGEVPHSEEKMKDGAVHERSKIQKSFVLSSRKHSQKTKPRERKIDGGKERGQKGESIRKMGLMWTCQKKEIMWES